MFYKHNFFLFFYNSFLSEFNMIFDVRYNEIALKGGNRLFFENKLIENIRLMLAREDMTAKVTRERGYILLDVDKDISHILKKTFGIKYFRTISKTERNIPALKEACLKYFEGFDRNRSFKVTARRMDKRYEMNSTEVAKEIGLFIERKTGIFGDIINPDYVLEITVAKNTFLISDNKHKGLGGLPVGVTGKVLCLISGGIDSPVAVWMVMKRGCTPILYTVACVKDKDVAIVNELKEKLEEYSPLKIKLINETIEDFNKIVLKLAEKKQEAFNCLVFKHYLLHRAEDLASKEKCLGLVTGDNLAQVASQTLENLNAQRMDLKLPVYSPLIGMDKDDIIEMSEKIGLFKISIRHQEDYFFLPRNPITRTKIEEFKRVLDFIK